MLVRMIKPNLIFSHDWHVQPNCQRSLRAIRLSGTLLDRGLSFTSACPRTCCAPELLLQQLPAFLREPSKHIGVPCFRQANLSLSQKPHKHAVGGCSSDAKVDRPVRRIPCLKASRSAKYQRSTGANRARAAKAHRRLTPGSCNGLFSPGNSLQGFRGLLPHPTQRTSITTSFPLPTTGQAQWPPGGLTCHLQLFKSSIRDP
jgi:hypothetical protein